MRAVHLLLGMLLTVVSSLTTAEPIQSNHLINIFQIDYPDAFSSYSTATAYSNTYQSGVSAYGDLSTGKTGSLSENSSGVNSIVSLYDTLTFSESTEVSFSYVLDGVLSSSNQFNHPYGQGRIDIFDITGMEYWLESSDLFGIPDVDVIEAAQEISSNSVLIDMDEISVFQSSLEDGLIIPDPLSRDGSLHQVDYQMNGTITVDPSKTYGIRLATNAYSGGASMADFLNTGAFSFTDLGGATFQSSSGQFLANQTSTVPSPAVIWLLLGGLAGRFLSRKRRWDVSTV